VVIYVSRMDTISTQSPNRALHMKKAVGAGFVAMLLAFVFVRSGRRVITEVVSLDALRCGVCNVWAITNHQSQEVHYVAHGLATGWVPVTGEECFSTLGDLAQAVRNGRFGVFPMLQLTFPGDPKELKEVTARNLFNQEGDALRALVPFYIELLERDGEEAVESVP
jgi:hypothetical protein